MGAQTVIIPDEHKITLKIEMDPERLREFRELMDTATRTLCELTRVRTHLQRRSALSDVDIIESTARVLPDD